MRFSSLETLKYILNEISIDINLLQTILTSNNVEYIFVNVNASELDENYLDSLLEMKGWQKNEHFAIYSTIFFKTRSLGYSIVGRPNGVTTSSNVIVINNLNFDKFIELYERTMKLKAFL